MSILDFEFKGRELTEEESKLFIKMFLISKRNNSLELPLCDERKLDEDPGTQIFLKRIEAYQLPFMVSNMFFVFSMHTWADNPGKLMTLLRLCYQHWKSSGKKYFTLDDWGLMFFPLGVPTDDELHFWWDLQKDADQPLSNKVDNPEFWKTEN